MKYLTYKTHCIRIFLHALDTRLDKFCTGRQLTCSEVLLVNFKLRNTVTQGPIWRKLHEQYCVIQNSLVEHTHKKKKKNAEKLNTSLDKLLNHYDKFFL